eukprot:117235_1
MAVINDIVDDVDDVIKYDGICFIIFGILFITYHIIFLIVAIIKRKKERNKIKYSSKNILLKVENTKFELIAKNKNELEQADFKVDKADDDIDDKQIITSLPQADARYTALSNLKRGNDTQCSFIFRIASAILIFIIIAIFPLIIGIIQDILTVNNNCISNKQTFSTLPSSEVTAFLVLSVIQCVPILFGFLFMIFEFPTTGIVFIGLGLPTNFVCFLMSFRFLGFWLYASCGNNKYMVILLIVLLFTYVIIFIAIFSIGAIWQRLRIFTNLKREISKYKSVNSSTEATLDEVAAQLGVQSEEKGKNGESLLLYYIDAAIILILCYLIQNGACYMQWIYIEIVNDASCFDDNIKNRVNTGEAISLLILTMIKNVIFRDFYAQRYQFVWIVRLLCELIPYGMALHCTWFWSLNNKCVGNGVQMFIFLLFVLWCLYPLFVIIWLCIKKKRWCGLSMDDTLMEALKTENVSVSLEAKLKPILQTLEKKDTIGRLEIPTGRTGPFI